MTDSYNMTFAYSAVLFLVSGTLTILIEVMLHYKPDLSLAVASHQPLHSSPTHNGHANQYEGRLKEIMLLNIDWVNSQLSLNYSTHAYKYMTLCPRNPTDFALFNEIRGSMRDL